MANLNGFNFFNQTKEQALYENLIVESIRQYAHNMYYLPRTRVGTDTIMNEVEKSTFSTALPIEFYIKSMDAFEGDGQFLSKFAPGLEIRDQITLNTSKRSFKQFIQPYTNRERPEEGDIVFVPMLNAAYQIKYIKSDAVWYAFGRLNLYELVLDLYENTGDTFATGVAMIDDRYPDRSDVSDTDYDVVDDNPQADNNNLETEAANYLDLSETDPFSE